MLNQKSELQRALEKQREAASRREAERNRDESYKDDPRTALQRALEQRAKHIEMAVSSFALFSGRIISSSSLSRLVVLIRETLMAEGGRITEGERLP